MKLKILATLIATTSLAFASTPQQPAAVDPFEKRMTEITIPFAAFQAAVLQTASAHARVAALQEALWVYRAVRAEQPVQQFAIVEKDETTYVVTITVPNKQATKEAPKVAKEKSSVIDISR